jgi:hypothetical protein
VKVHPRRVALSLIVAMLCATATTNAHAATVVTGGDMTTEALEILPDADPLTHDIDIGQARAVAYIKRMPATRTVVRVTLGDLARASSCTQDVGVRLYVDEYEADNWPNGYVRRITSTGNPTLTAAHSDLVFTIPATTFREGRLYVLQVQTMNTSLCRTASLRTWAHNSPAVGPGADHCQQIPENGTFAWRMWHETGSTDAVNCPDSRPTPSNFDPTMPTGWLLVYAPGPSSSLVTLQNYPSSGPAAGSYCGNLHPSTGIVPERWREHQALLGWSEYVCRWSQFEAPNALFPTPDHWYHGGPWNIPGTTGAPRDVHLKLETINYDPLIARYAPVLLYDSEEEFDAVSPGAMTDFFDAGSLLPDDSNSIRDSATFAIADPRYLGQAPGDLSELNLDFLGPIYGDPIETDGRREGTGAEATDNVSARGDASDDLYAGDAATMAAQDEYGNRVYARVAHGADSRVWVQYWIFYYFNSLVPVHEGDWELIQVGLNEVTHIAERAVYAQHGGGQWCPWNSVEKVGDKPVVYVARHSHASYFHAVTGDDDSVDFANGQREPAGFPAAESINSLTPSWVGWTGKWGDSDTSPEGPGHGGNTDRWNYPGLWTDELSLCE